MIPELDPLLENSDQEIQRIGLQKSINRMVSVPLGDHVYRRAEHLHRSVSV